METGILYVDDAAALVTGADFHITHDELKDIMNCKGGILEWAAAHNCSFGIKKFQLVDLSQQKIKDGRVLGLATYTRLKLGRETGARYLHYMEVGTISCYSLGKGKLLHLCYTEVGTKVME
jgi:hypothetical protein